MNIMNSLGEALRDVITFVPKLLLFLVILLIGWLIAKALRKLVTLGLRKVGFDRAVERGGIKRALQNSKYDAIGIVAAVVYFGVLLIALQMAFGAFGPNPVSELLTEIVAWLPRLVVAIVIVVVAAAAGRALGDLTGSALGGVSWGHIAAKAVFGFIVALGVIAALVTAPVLIAILATVGGILVVGVGGGMVKPMQQRWEGWLHKAETEAPMARRQMQAYQRGREDAARAQQQTAAAGQHADVPAGVHAAAPSGQHAATPAPATGQPGGQAPPTGPVQQQAQPTPQAPPPPASQPPPSGQTRGPSRPGFDSGNPPPMPPPPPPQNG